MDVVLGLWIHYGDLGKDVEDWGSDVLWFFVVEELNIK